MSARVAMVAGIFAGLAVLAACMGAAYWVLLPERFPVSRVEIKGELKNTGRAQIEGALPRVDGNFFVVDLADVRARVERLPWVRRVAVRRVWPGGLEVTIEEHVALARWGEADEVAERNIATLQPRLEHRVVDREDTQLLKMAIELRISLFDLRRR